MQEPGHGKNPAAVALGRLGGLAGRGKAKARKVTSEMARRAVMARWAKYKASLPLLLGLWMACGQSAFCQGSIFLYTFSGDDSPLHVSASVTTSHTGFLTETNILSGYMEQGGRRVPFYSLSMSVSPGGVSASRDSPRAVSFFGMDEIDIDGRGGGSVHVVIYPWVDSPQSYISAGKWSVAIVPEPASFSLLLLAGCCCWRARRLLQRARR